MAACAVGSASADSALELAPPPPAATFLDVLAAVPHALAAFLPLELVAILAPVSRECADTADFILRETRVGV